MKQSQESRRRLEGCASLVDGQLGALTAHWFQPGTEHPSICQHTHLTSKSLRTVGIHIKPEKHGTIEASIEGQLAFERVALRLKCQPQGGDDQRMRLPPQAQGTSHNKPETPKTRC